MLKRDFAVVTNQLLLCHTPVLDGSLTLLDNGNNNIGIGCKKQNS
jgi:hypothetical protein